MSRLKRSFVVLNYAVSYIIGEIDTARVNNLLSGRKKRVSSSVTVARLDFRSGNFEKYYALNVRYKYFVAIERWDVTFL